MPVKGCHTLRKCNPIPCGFPATLFRTVPALLLPQSTLGQLLSAQSMTLFAGLAALKWLQSGRYLNQSSAPVAFLTHLMKGETNNS